MPSVARGVAELRISDRSGIYRAFYYTQSPRGILVFHAFAKKSQATAKHELELARKRLKELPHKKTQINRSPHGRRTREGTRPQPRRRRRTRTPQRAKFKNHRSR